MVVTLGQQYNFGEKPSVILYTYINRHAGTPDTHQTQKQCSTPSNMVVIIYCFIGCRDILFFPLYGRQSGKWCDCTGVKPSESGEAKKKNPTKSLFADIFLKVHPTQTASNWQQHVFHRQVRCVLQSTVLMTVLTSPYHLGPWASLIINRSSCL